MIGAVAAQGNRVSPHEATELALNGKKITITYGRPSMKGRKIMGELVPFSQVWRTGADEASRARTMTSVSYAFVYNGGGTGLSRADRARRSQCRFGSVRRQIDGRKGNIIHRALRGTELR